MSAYLSNSLILDGYRLIRFLGRGGFGEVWLCRSESMGDYRALKFIPTTHGDRLEKEYGALLHYRKAAAQLRSPHLVPIEHVNRNETGLFYVMPLADGSGAADPADPPWQPVSLTTMIHERSEMPTWFSSKEIIALIHPVLEALQTLSDAGLVHRDVKPDNILFFHGQPCLGDISLLGADASVITRRGTPGYGTPSWYVGGLPDMYGVAATLFTLLTGNSPDRMARSAFLWPPQGEASLSSEEWIEWKRLHGVIRRATNDKVSERFVDFKTMADFLPKEGANVIARSPEPRLPRFIASALTVAGIAAATLVAGYRINQSGKKTKQVPPPSTDSQTANATTPELTAEQKTDYQALAGMIQGYIADGQYANALASVNMLLTNYPQSRTQPAYSIARAMALHGLDRTDEAKAELRKDLHLSPNISAMTARKDLWIEYGDLPEAEKDLTRILEKFGPASFPLFLRADIRARLGNFSGVHADKQAAYAAEPEELEHRRLVDSMWAPLETKYPGYHEYIKTLPPDPYDQVAPGAIRAGDIDHDNGWILEVFDSIMADVLPVDTGLSEGSIRFRKGMAKMCHDYFKNEKYEEVLKLLNQILYSSPAVGDSQPMSLFRALMFKRLDRLDEAEDELVKLCHRSHDAMFIEARVCLLSALDRKREAEALLTRMIDEVSPNSGESRKLVLSLLELRARIRAILGDFTGTQEDHAAALDLLVDHVPDNRKGKVNSGDDQYQRERQLVDSQWTALQSKYPAYADYLKSRSEK